MRRKFLIILTLALVGIGLVLLFGISPKIFDYAIKKRIIKVIGILACGLAVGVSTTAFQAITTNRILTPSIFGLDTLYLTVQAAIIFFLTPESIMVKDPYINFVLSFLIMTGFSVLMFRFMFSRLKGIFLLLLVGIVFSVLFQSIVGLLQMLMDPTSFEFYQAFMFASFNNINEAILYFVLALVALLSAYLYSQNKSMDVLSLGKDKAINLGLDYDKTALAFLVCVFILTAASTALVGPITFLGFMVVNITITYLNTYQNQYLLPASTLIAIIVLAFGHVLTEELLGVGVPISILINIVGGLYFIHMLLREKLS